MFTECHILRDSPLLYIRTMNEHQVLERYIISVTTTQLSLEDATKTVCFQEMKHVCAVITVPE